MEKKKKALSHREISRMGGLARDPDELRAQLVKARKVRDAMFKNQAEKSAYYAKIGAPGRALIAKRRAQKKRR